MFHIRAPANAASLRIVEIGFAPRAIEEIAPRGRFLERADLQHLIRARPVNSHKGMYGHPLVIAGGRGKSGAVLLASRAALRMGAGLVTAAMPESIQPIVAAGQAELMTEPIADRDGHFDGAHAPDALKMLLDGKNAMIVGPGIGVERRYEAAHRMADFGCVRARASDADRCRRAQRGRRDWLRCFEACARAQSC